MPIIISVEKLFLSNDSLVAATSTSSKEVLKGTPAELTCTTTGLGASSGYSVSIRFHQYSLIELLLYASVVHKGVDNRSVQ